MYGFNVHMLFIIKKSDLPQYPQICTILNIWTFKIFYYPVFPTFSKIRLKTQPGFTRVNPVGKPGERLAFRTLIFESIILILAGNEDMHESLDEFKFRPDTDTNTRVICPCASEKLLYNVVTTLAPSFLIGSSSYMQVTRTSITSQTSSKFGQIRPRTAELAALERLEKSP